MGVRIDKSRDHDLALSVDDLVDRARSLDPGSDGFDDAVPDVDVSNEVESFTGHRDDQDVLDLCPHEQKSDTEEVQGQGGKERRHSPKAGQWTKEICVQV